MELPFSQACENNKDPILEVLKTAFSDCTRVLEVGSGTGQHAVYFASQLPNIHWQASDQKEYLPGVTARIKQEGVTNQPLPVEFDVFADAPGGNIQRSFHRKHLPYYAQRGVERLFEHLEGDLSSVERLCIYGPFNDNGHFTSDSNRGFHQSLQSRNSDMGIRDWQWITELANQQGFELKKIHPLPANNQLLEFQR